LLYTLLGYITEYTKKLRENIITIHNSQIVFFLEHFFQLQPFMSKLMINLLKFVKEKKNPKQGSSCKTRKNPKNPKFTKKKLCLLHLLCFLFFLCSPFGSCNFNFGPKFIFLNISVPKFEQERESHLKT